MHYIKITKIHYIFILNISLGNIIQYIPATNKSFGHCSRGGFRLHKDDARFQIGELFYGFYPIQILSNRFSVLSLFFFFTHFGFFGLGWPGGPTFGFSLTKHLDLFKVSIYVLPWDSSPFFTAIWESIC